MRIRMLSLFLGLAVGSTAALAGTMGICAENGGRLCAPTLSYDVTSASGAVGGSALEAVLGDGGTWTSEFTSGIEGVYEVSSGFVATNADPFVNYSFGVANFTAAPLTFTFSFSSPYVGGPYTTMSTSHSGSATDGNGNGSIAISPAAPYSEIHNAFFDATFPAAGAISTGCAAAVTAGDSIACGMGSATFPAATAASGNFGVILKFTVSPGDLYSVNGRVELLNESEVPEPSTYGLIGFGLLGLLAGRFRR